MGVIMHKNVSYGGGSVVEPNPQESATEQLETLGIDGDVYEVTDADYRNTDHTFTMNTYSSYSHTFEDTQISQKMPVRNVFTGIQSLFNSVKTAINDHGSLFGDIATALTNKVSKDEATYKSLSYSSITHEIDDSEELTTQFDGAGEMGSVWFANMNLGIVTDAVNDHAEWIAKETAGSKTVTGNPITITDAAGIKAEKIEIGFEPQQDKHGYNSVWVGGAGKNKLPIKDTIATTTLNGVTFTVEKDIDGNVVSIDVDSNGSAATGLANFELTNFTTVKNGTILSGCPSGGNYSSSYSLAIVNNSYSSVFIDQGSGVNITSDTTGCKVVIFVRSGYTISHKKFYPMIRESGQTATYEPPSNISPITGYTSIGVDRCGKNLFGGLDFANALHDASNTSTIDTTNKTVTYNRYKTETTVLFDKLKPNTTYTLILTGNVNSANTTNNSIALRNTDNGLYGLTFNSTTKTRKKITFDNVKDLILTWANGAMATVYYDECGLFEGEVTVEQFEEYLHQRISLQLGNKNLLPMTVDKLKEINTGGTWSGNVYTLNNATFTVNTDKDGLITGIKINTSSAVTTGVTFNVGTNLSYNAGSYILSTGDTLPSGLMFAIQTEGGNVTVSNANSANVTNKITNSLCWIYIPNTVSVSNYTIKPMLRSATVTDPTFSPYNPSLGDMIYGGQLTLKDDGSAVFVGDRICLTADFNTTGAFANYPTNRWHVRVYQLTTLSTTADNTKLVCDRYKTEKNTSGTSNCWLEIVSNATMFYFNTATAYSSFNDMVSACGYPTFTVPLATPFTIHLSPVETLTLLQGINNVWTDGTTLSLTYQPDNAIGQAKGTAQDAMAIANGLKPLYSTGSVGSGKTGTWKIAEITLPEAGIYYITGWARFTGNGKKAVWLWCEGSLSESWEDSTITAGEPKTFSTFAIYTASAAGKVVQVDSYTVSASNAVTGGIVAFKIA